MLCPCCHDSNKYIYEEMNHEYFERVECLGEIIDEGVCWRKYRCWSCNLTFVLKDDTPLGIWVCNENFEYYSNILIEKFEVVSPFLNIVANRKVRYGTYVEPIDKKELLIKQNNRCNLCGADLDKVKKELDHIVPISVGAPEIQENMQYLCKSCNRAKRDKIGEMWGNLELYNKFKKEGRIKDRS